MQPKLEKHCFRPKPVAVLMAAAGPCHWAYHCLQRQENQQEAEATFRIPIAAMRTLCRPLPPLPEFTVKLLTSNALWETEQSVKLAAADNFFQTHLFPYSMLTL